MTDVILKEAGTFLVFVFVILICLLKEWIEGDLYWCTKSKMLTTKKIDRKKTKNNYCIRWKDLKCDR